MKHCGRRFSALLLTFSLLFSLPLTPVLAEEPLPEEAESEYEAVSLPAADAAEEGTPDADLPEEVPPFAEEPLSPEEETPEESGENALPPAEELPAEETEVPEEAQLPEELPEEDFDPFAYEAEEPLASYYSSNIDQPNDGSAILIYPQLQGGMMLVGQPAFFSLVNWGPGSYEYNFHLLYRAPSEGSEYYNGTVGSWSFVYHSGVQESSSFTYTPELSGVYCLSATVTDKDSGRIVRVQDFYICTTLTGSGTTLGDAVEGIIAECRAMNLPTVWDQALYVHNYLTTHARYDTTYTCYYPDGVLLREKGVCQSYALAYRIIMERMGIPCLYVSGVSGDTGGSHAWNILWLEGKWWHVDVTWDDPISGKSVVSGKERTAYFCLEDSVMGADHYWDRYSYPVCSGSSKPKTPAPDRALYLPAALQLRCENGEILDRESLRGTKTVLLFSDGNPAQTTELLSYYASLRSTLEKYRIRLIVAVREEDRELLAAFHQRCPEALCVTGLTEELLPFLSGEDGTVSTPAALAVNQDGIVTSLITGASRSRAQQTLADTRAVDLSGLFTYTLRPDGAEINAYTGAGRSGIAYPAEIGGQRVIRLPDLGSGTLSCGLSWVLDAKGELTLRGSGALLCEADGSYPWDALRGEIRSLRTEEGVSSLGASAFEGCRALRSVTLGEDIRELGARALAGTAVEALRLPAGLCSLDPTALEDCRALQTLQAAEDSEFFSSVDGVLYDRAQQQLLLCPAGRTGTLTLPASVRGLGCSLSACPFLSGVSVSPENPCFKSIDGLLCSADGSVLLACPGGRGGTVFLPAGVERIGEGAFAGHASLSTAILGEGVRVIEAGAFACCPALVQLDLPLSLCSVGADAFSGCAGLTVVYPGRESEWKRILPEAGNEALENARLFFESGTEYVWSEDCLSCTAYGMENGQSVTAEAVVRSVETRPGDYMTEGELTCTASFAEPWAQEQVTVVNTGTVEVIWGETEYTWSEELDSCAARRTSVNFPELSDTAVTAVSSAVTAEPGCGREGVLTHTAAFAEDWAGVRTVSETLSALEHRWVYDSTDTSSLPYRFLLRCENCGDISYEAVPTPKASLLTLSCGSRASVYINECDSFTVSASVLPANAGQGVVWSGMKTAYGSYTPMGSSLRISDFTGKTGSLTLTASASDGSGVKARVTLTFARRAQQLSILDGKNRPLTSAVLKGKSSTSFRTSAALDKTLTDKSVVWSLSSTDYASVDSKGRVTVRSFAGSEQTVLLTAACGPVSESIPLTLLPDLKESLTLFRDDELVSGRSLTLDLNSGSVELRALLTGTDGPVSWKSSSTKLAAVDAEGRVTLLAPGTVTVTAACGRVRSSVKLSIVRYAEGLTLSGPAVLASGKSASYKAVLTPSKPSDRTVLWSLAPGGEAYASVKNGKLTARKGLTHPVNVTLIAASRDGAAMQELTVTLLPLTAAVNLYENGTAVGGRTVSFDGCGSFTLVNAPMSALQSWSVKCSSRDVAVTLSGSTVTARSLKPLRSGTRVTLTLTAADGSGRSVRVTLKAL